MKSFSEFLYEMTAIEAVSILGLTGTWTDKDVDRAFRSLAMKHHSDRGGTQKAMTDLNVARKLLKGKSSGITTKSQGFDWTESDKQYVMLKQFVNNDLASKFDVLKFVEHFSTIFNTNFYFKELSNELVKRNKYYAGITYQFYDKDKTHVFDFSVYVDLQKIKHNKKTGLTYGDTDISYDLTVEANAYSGRKKVKITKRNWTNTNHHKVLAEPSIAFPVAKLTKKQTRKFSKRDMITFLTKELGAVENNKDLYFVPLNDPEYYYKLFRLTYQRTAIWTLYGVYKKEKYKYIQEGNSHVISFPETEETTNIFKKLSTMGVANALSEINKLKEGRK
jgi:hypothetical protein